MDAQAQDLFRRGVAAVREDKDMFKGRDLLLQSLKLDPNNELAWLWLSRTTSDPYKKLQCLERANKLNPNNVQTTQLMAQLKSQTGAETNTTPAAPPNLAKIEGDVKRITGETSPIPPDIAQRRAAKSASKAPQSPGELRAALLNTEVMHPADVDSLGLPVVPVPTSSKPAPSAKTTAPAVTSKVTKQAPVAAKSKTSVKEDPRIPALLEEAQRLVKANDIEAAIGQWVEVLDIEVDHEVALGNAVRYLSRLKYMDDAEELTMRAIQAGTQHPSIYLTAIDIAKYKQEYAEADELRMGLATLPTVDEKTFASLIEHFGSGDQAIQQMSVLEQAVQRFPRNQAFLLMLADHYATAERKEEAVALYELTAKINSSSKEGLEADQKLTSVSPNLSDRERGSVALALREASGFAVLALLMAWQDAGLNLMAMGTPRLLGIGLSFLGGYFLITATSSPQQQPLAALLGGSPPPPSAKRVPKVGEEAPTGLEDSQLPIIPQSLRAVLGVVGMLILAFGLYLVFSRAINLVMHPDSTDFCLPSIEYIFSTVESGLPC